MTRSQLVATRTEVVAAVDAPRVHCDGGEVYVDSRIPQEVRQRLEEMGHTVIVQEQDPGSNSFGRFGRVNAVRIDLKTGLLHAGSGPA